MQERRHLDLVYNFGSHLTDTYKPASDPALSDPSLRQRLRSNREVALSRLEEVITKFAKRQDDTEEQERIKRLEKDGKEKEEHKAENGEENKEENGVAEKKDDDKEGEEVEEEEEDEDEDDESSDPDIEEEIQASTQQDGPDDDENEEDESNEVDQTCNGTNKEDQTDEVSGSVSAGEEGSVKEEDEEPVTSRIQHSPSQSEPPRTDNQRPLSNGNLAKLEESVDSTNHVSVVLVSNSKITADSADAPLVEANGVLLLPSPAVVVEKCDTQTNGTSPPPSPRTTRGQKRKRAEIASVDSQNTKHIIIHDNETEIPLDMGVFTCGSPQQAESTRVDTPTQEIVSSSQSTPPPKKNK
ncbi:hypothetical protein L3Q82_015448, partial [Scortum barcoo]